MANGNATCLGYTQNDVDLAYRGHTLYLRTVALRESLRDLGMTGQQVYRLAGWLSGGWSS